MIRSISRLPPVMEDLALIVDDGVAAAAVESCISAAAGGLLRQIELFDHYRGEQIGGGKKSLAYRLIYQSDERTLTDEEVAAVREKIVGEVEAQLGGRLRS